MTTPMLQRAIDLARMNKVRGLPRMAAILVTRDGDEYVGFNSRKTHPLAKKFGRNKNSICLHAEIDAIRKAVQQGSRLDRASLVVARVFKNGNPAFARPCEGCQRAILGFGIEEVEWTT